MREDSSDKNNLKKKRFELLITLLNDDPQSKKRAEDEMKTFISQIT